MMNPLSNYTAALLSSGYQQFGEGDDSCSKGPTCDHIR